MSTHSRIIDLFRLLDRNLDGAVTKQELATALDSLRIECTTDELDELFDYLDPNGDGVIVFRELQQAIYAAQRGGRPSQAVPSHAKRSRPPSPYAGAPTGGGGAAGEMAASRGGLSPPAAIEGKDWLFLSEMVEVARSSVAQDLAQGKPAAMSLLRMTSAYETVRRRSAGSSWSRVPPRPHPRPPHKRNPSRTP